MRRLRDWLTRSYLGAMATVAILLLVSSGPLGAQATKIITTTGVVYVRGPISIAAGGTGISSYAVGDLLYASGTTTLSKLADVAVGSVLVSGGVNTAPAWSTNPTATSFTAAGANGFCFSSSLGCIKAPSDGVFELLNNAGTDFARLQFGGTTSSFPALKRSGIALQVRSADDSIFADLMWRNAEAQNSGYIGWTGRALLRSTADSVVTFNNNAGTTTATLTVPTGTANVVPVVVALGRATAQTAANASVSTFTVGAADTSFEVSANVLVTTATTHSFTVTCAYTDEGNTARTLTMPFTLVAGSAIVNAVANGNGTVPYMGIVQHIRAKAATTITIATTGTFTTVTYNVEGLIKKVT